MGDVLDRAAAARPPRHFRAVQARQADHRRRPAAVHGEPALHQGRARQRRARQSADNASASPKQPQQRARASSPSSAAISTSSCSAGRTGSTSRRPARAFRCSACTPPAPTGGNTAACSTTSASPDHFRVIVFDMPWHGKSSPPEGYQNEEYKLTSRDYVRMVLEIVRRAAARQAGGDGLLDRRPHRALSGAPAR